jgi:hypothetical protein
MDKLAQYRQIIQKIINQHSTYQSADGDITTIPIFDPFQDNYLLINLGWDRTGRVHNIDLHLRIQDQKIWIEWDGTENSVVEELIRAGVANEDIVLGFYRPERRSLVDFVLTS